MTNDPFRSPPGTNPPRHVAQPSNAPWIGGAIVVAALLGLGIWMVGHKSATTTANPPAVTAAPAPAAGVPAPRPEETTGQAAPRAK
jgi:hypothetical protein